MGGIYQTVGRFSMRGSDSPAKLCTIYQTDAKTAAVTALHPNSDTIGSPRLIPT